MTLVTDPKRNLFFSLLIFFFKGLIQSSSDPYKAYATQRRKLTIVGRRFKENIDIIDLLLPHCLSNFCRFTIIIIIIVIIIIIMIVIIVVVVVFVFFVVVVCI